MKTEKRSIVAALPIILGLGLIAYQTSPPSRSPVEKPRIFPAPPQSSAPLSDPQDWDAGPASDRMLVTVPADLTAPPSMPAPYQDPSLPLTAFSRQNVPGAEPQEIAPPEQAQQAPPPQRDDWWPQDRHLILLPSLSMDGDAGYIEIGTGESQTGGRGSGFGRRSHGHRHGRRR